MMKQSKKIKRSKRTKEAELIDYNSIMQSLANLNTLVTGEVQDDSLTAEEHAQAICSFYQNILANMPNNVYWLDKNCILRGGNDNLARFFGLNSAADLAGLTYEQMSALANWTEGQGQSFKAAELKVMSSGISQLNVEEPVIFQKGEPRYYISSKVPLYNQKKEVIGVLGISTDITDLKQAKEKAEAANQAKTEFIMNMSHDIRTPLSGIVQMSNILKKKLKDPEAQQEAEWLSQSGAQLLELSNSILDLNSAENNKEQDIIRECFDLRELITSIVQLETPTIKSKGLDLSIDIDPAIPHYLVTDRIKFHRILLNLVGNAIKFTEKGSVGIAIKLLEQTPDKVTLEISVSDTAMGIAPALQEKIFSRFFRAHASYKGLYRGHGLGLYIAQQYVQLLGGESIRVESEEGKGSRFSFILPCEIGRQEEATQPTSQDSSGSQPHEILPQVSLSILLIEDNFIALHGLESLVTEVGCHFTSVPDAEKGLDLATRHDFDLIITDIGLPGLSGIEFAQKLRAWEKLNHRAAVPIIGLTGHALQETLEECLQAGMNQVIAKPANLDSLTNLIRQFSTYCQPIISDENSLLAEPAVGQKEQGVAEHRTGVYTPVYGNSCTEETQPFSPAVGLCNESNVAAKKSESISAELKQSSSTSALGIDLPETESSLFALEQYPLFDMTEARNIFGEACDAIIPDLLKAMVASIPHDKAEITQAFIARDWQGVQDVAHRIKGGAASCGITRLRYACQYLERYRKAGHSKLSEKLYEQLIQVMDETDNYLNNLNIP